MKPFYNIIYIQEDGSTIHGRRLDHINRIELEDGRRVTKPWASENLDYAGKRKTEYQQRRQFEYFTTPNGFKVRRFIGP